MLIWKKESSLPKALQDCSVAVISDKLIVLGGFCSGSKVSVVLNSVHYKEEYARKKDKYIRGFSNAVYMKSLSSPSTTWDILPPFPSQPRASMGTTVIGNKLYCWGGYSFLPNPEPQNPPQLQHFSSKAECCAYKDGYMLQFLPNSNQNQNQNPSEPQWIWTKLPNLPYPLTNFNIVNDSRWIYICGGANIHQKTKSHDTTNTGTQCWKIDSFHLIDSKTPSQWIPLATFLGSHRMDASMTLHQSQSQSQLSNLKNQAKIYYIGGIQPNSQWEYKDHNTSKSRYYNVMDNWIYHIETNQWTPLHTSNSNSNINIPYVSGWAMNQSLAIPNRWIYLFGGAYYDESIHMNQICEQNTSNGKRNPRTNEYGFIISKDIYRYDIIKNEFEKLQTKLPFPINKPKWCLHQNIFHLIGGESVPAGGKYLTQSSSTSTSTSTSTTSTPIEGYVFDDEFFGYHLDLHLSGTIKKFS